MNLHRIHWKTLALLAPAALGILSMAWIFRIKTEPAAYGAQFALEPAFAQTIQPFLKKNCQTCHNADNPTSGVRVDNLDATLPDPHIRFWEAIKHRVQEGSMPPKGMPQPSPAEREQLVAWVTRALERARMRPAPKNGSVRRLTVAQYRNTLRELLDLEDDLTEILPPDAISRDGFVNNRETLQLSPLLMEAYLEIAEKALQRVIVDPAIKPFIQNFRMDLGESINPAPLKEELILGANSLLLENKDFTVTQLTAKKPFPFEPFFMQTRYRFIEGYRGNDTVRGWREYDSIYHAVFACMRGSRGYPKGQAYSTVPEGLLLRPAIPNEEQFDSDGTYGPKANFKISLRELPDEGRFRVTVMAAKYDDGLLLDKGAAPAAQQTDAIIAKASETINVAKAGIYQVDVHQSARRTDPVPADSSRLSQGLIGSWNFEADTPTEVRIVDSPFGKALSLRADTEMLKLPRPADLNVGAGDFTVAAWIHPRALRKSGIISLGAEQWSHGWYFEVNNGGGLRLATTGSDEQSNGIVSAPAGILRANAWQHVAAVVRRGAVNQTLLYVNGFPVAKGTIGSANLDNPNIGLFIGRLPNAQPFRGDLDEIRVYGRALNEAELQALIEPGRQFAKAPPERPPDVTLQLGARRLTGTLQQPAFAVVRLPAGSLPVSADTSGTLGVDRVVLTPLTPESTLARRFAVFEKRVPKLGVHLGLRRDCGSTFAPAGPPQAVAGTHLQRFIFEGAIRNFPSPDVEKDNVNYLAGVREIAVRSEFTDGRDMPRLLIRSIEFEGPLYETWPPKPHTNIFVSKEPREILRRFATRAYRRPVTQQEEAALVAVFEKAKASGRTFTESMQDALLVALTSPQFLFITEKSATPQPEPLDEYELASKLSYFLWNGPPDEELLRLARAGMLRKQLDREVDRMIADRKFTRFTAEFIPQWLSLDKFQVLEPDRKRYPKLTRDMRLHLQKEPIQFVQHLIRENLPARNLIASDFIMADEGVASYYDMPDKSESGFDFLPVRHGRRELGGLLTQPAILAGLSDGRESNPVKRGAWIARKIVAEPPADPPPNVPALKEDASQKLTLRQRIERHRSQPGCQQCHSKVDPWGVALEEFDAGGRWKTEPADARSTLPDGTEVAGMDDLKKYLGDSRIDQVAFSVLKHLATYATGRSLTYSEQHHLKQDSQQQLRAGGYRMKELIRYVAHSKVFLEK